MGTEVDNEAAQSAAADQIEKDLLEAWRLARAAKCAIKAAFGAESTDAAQKGLAGALHRLVDAAGLVSLYLAPSSVGAGAPTARGYQVSKPIRMMSVDEMLALMRSDLFVMPPGEHDKLLMASPRCHDYRGRPRPLSVKTRARVAKAIDRFGGDEALESSCPGCMQVIDPEVCGCGDSKKDHDSMSVGHAFVPMGCRCLEVSHG